MNLREAAKELVDAVDYANRFSPRSEISEASGRVRAALGEPPPLSGEAQNETSGATGADTRAPRLGQEAREDAGVASGHSGAPPQGPTEILCPHGEPLRVDGCKQCLLDAYERARVAAPPQGSAPQSMTYDEFERHVEPLKADAEFTLTLKPPGSAERDAITKVVIPMTEYRALVARVAELERGLRPQGSAPLEGGREPLQRDWEADYWKAESQLLKAISWGERTFGYTNNTEIRPGEDWADTLIRVAGLRGGEAPHEP